MAEFDFEEIEQEIQSQGWFRFGEEQFECPALGDEELEFYLENSRLPSPCDRCYKALVFWGRTYSEQNLRHFFDMIDSFDIDHRGRRGKLDRGVAMFYFRDKAAMREFLEYLAHKMQEYGVEGRTQWRRACKEYQDLAPRLWRNAKEFIPDSWK